MRALVNFLALALILLACNKEDDLVSPNIQDGIPVVYSSSTYDIIVEEDLIYGEGLKHETLNSANTTTMSLKLDVYAPNNDSQNRPAYLFIHGGGFTGGSKQQSQIVDLANYYAARGWVFYSIDYRLLRDKGTVPQEWVDYSMTIEEELRSQFLAIYPAHRDAKAALRWIIANAEKYGINTDYITVGGGSAGAITAIALGISEEGDFKDEINANQDPTLGTTNLNQSYQIGAVVDYWGSDVSLDALNEVYGHQRFDANDPPLLVVHGTEDPTVLFSNAVELKAIYESLDLSLSYYPLEGLGHGAWNATVDGKGLDDLTFDFIVEHLNLKVE